MPKSDHCDDNSSGEVKDNVSIIRGEIRSQIWLIGGTTEGLELSRQLVQSALPCTVSVTTEAARQRYPQAPPSLRLQVQRFNRESLMPFLTSENIAAVLDASHPHAAEISMLAMQGAAAAGIPYLRFERPAVTAPVHDSVQEIKDIAAILTDEYLLGKRVLLTVGAKALGQFQPWQSRSTLFARILPSQLAFQAATAAGFLPERLIALRPPISAELEVALWQQWQIETVVTKASGQLGGETVKRQAAAALNIPLIVIQRPPLIYPRQTSDVGDAIAFCRNALSSSGT